MPLIACLVMLVNAHNAVFIVEETVNNTVDSGGDWLFPNFSNRVSDISSEVRNWMLAFELLWMYVFILKKYSLFPILLWFST